MPKILVIKNNGEKEVYRRSKLISSLMRANASKQTIDKIVTEIESGMYNGISTSEIYNKAHSLLKKSGKTTAAKYSIRRSILNLGPTGFPFEKFIAQIYQTLGYKTKTGYTMQGKCSKHEVDIIAYNDKELIFGEIKFHNQLGIKTDTKVALYIKARFDDLRSQKFKIDGKDRMITRGLIVTNTKFTDNAINFVNCCGGINLISWDYPNGKNLYDLIEETKIHPMTCIPLLSKNEKQELLKQGIVNCLELKNKKKTMKDIGIPDYKINEIVDNIELICSHNETINK